MVAQIKALQMTPAEAVARWARAQQLGVVERHRARVATWELIARRGWVHDAQEWLGMLNTSRDVLATFDGDMQRALGEAEAMEAGEGDTVEGRGEAAVATGPGSGALHGARCSWTPQRRRRGTRGILFAGAACLYFCAVTSKEM